MRQTLHILYFIIGVALMVGCMDKGTGGNHVPRSKDTLYTQKAAMSIYGYQPVRALRILDSAVIVGNLSELHADMLRARIYSSTLMRHELDSLLGGPEDICLDTARAIGERLLKHDSVEADLRKQQDVLDVLSRTARLQQDTLGWIQLSRKLVDVCRQLNPDAEADALRSEAEIGAALCCQGEHEQGMAKLDSVIERLCSFTPGLSPGFRFNELDALIIALKRKIMALSLLDRNAETLPLARSIIEHLDDYEQHPAVYHDGSDREPQDSISRGDYIRFYRSQAQNFITAAYTSLGEHGNMITAYGQIERSVRDATAREHIARYHALQLRMEAEHQQLKASRANMTAVIVGIFALVVIVFAFLVIYQNRDIRHKNRLLAQQIAEAVNYKQQYWEEKWIHSPMANDSDLDLSSLTDEQLFQYINEVIVRERLFLDPKFERQNIMDRFQLSKERVGAVFSKGSKYVKLTSYIQQLRLDWAAHQLVEQPEKSIVEIAEECGFGSHTYFSDRFHQHFGMSPSDFRREALERDDVYTCEPRCIYVWVLM